jgi:zinc/manganese transport system substrate-binding protein
MRLFLLLALLLSLAEARVTVAVSYPYIASLTETVGGAHVRVETLAQGNWDPHFVVPKPSLITRVRNADLLITNGADLEIGWLPPLLARASNADLAQKGNLLELSRAVRLIEVPRDTSRAGGDVHAQGNPHFHLDPRNIPLLADAIAEFLGRKDPANASEYRHNAATFKQLWSGHLKRWEAQMAPMRGKEVIQYHGVFNYFLHAYGMRSVATIEPLAGIPPSSAHTMKLVSLIAERKPCCILHDVYHPTRTGEFLKSKTGIRLIVLPHDVGATRECDDLVALFDALVQSLR